MSVSSDAWPRTQGSHECQVRLAERRGPQRGEANARLVEETIQKKRGVEDKREKEAWGNGNGREKERGASSIKRKKRAGEAALAPFSNERSNDRAISHHARESEGTQTASSRFRRQYRQPRSSSQAYSTHCRAERRRRRLAEQNLGRTDAIKHQDLAAVTVTPSKKKKKKKKEKSAVSSSSAAKKVAALRNKVGGPPKTKVSLSELKARVKGECKKGTNSDAGEHEDEEHKMKTEIKAEIKAETKEAPQVPSGDFIIQKPGPEMLHRLELLLKAIIKEGGQLPAEYSVAQLTDEVLHQSPSGLAQSKSALASRSIESSSASLQTSGWGAKNARKSKETNLDEVDKLRRQNEDLRDQTRQLQEQSRALRERTNALQRRKGTVLADCASLTRQTEVKRASDQTIIKQHKRFRQWLEKARLIFFREGGKHLTKQDLDPIVEYAWIRRPGFRELYEKEQFDEFARKLCEYVELAYNSKISWQTSAFLCTLRLIRENVFGAKTSSALVTVAEQAASAKSMSRTSSQVTQLSCAPSSSSLSSYTSLGPDPSDRSDDKTKRKPTRKERRASEGPKLTRRQRTIQGNIHRNPDLSKAKQKTDGEFDDQSPAPTAHDDGRGGDRICTCCSSKHRDKKLTAAAAASQQAIAAGADFFDASFICIFCDYKLIYGEYPKMKRALRRARRANKGIEVQE
ncbi:hypothetical protein FA10DRAFT_27289 [Acaromyces ingoldii]|uniref:Uncharacterized protein n=1 Tax=Acaromyces ingoldii TaxID=215250 RepID=A0A316YX31_9BASI|nr:hypothetical protein FA10DRAFT_27289 [Acaromyces ingoldii]PWN93606.1 hypothetical protein FA10DRAFT_27289 [Acaromyces ingoldii]